MRLLMENICDFIKKSGVLKFYCLYRAPANSTSNLVSFRLSDRLQSQKVITSPFTEEQPDTNHLIAEEFS
jgi:hypothetical protein